MRRVIALALVLAVVGLVNPARVVAAQAQTGTVAGTATDAAKNPLANHTVRLRAVSGPQQGQLVASVQSAANGTFSLAVTPGTYVVEVVNAAGQIVGASTPIAVAAGVTATVTVAASAVAAAAAAAGATGLAGLFTGTSLLVATSVALAGVVVAVQVNGAPTASASR